MKNINLLIILIAAFASYWYETETLLFFVGAFYMIRFLYEWYKPVFGTWPPSHGKPGRFILGALPIVAFVVNLYTLLTMAAYDVVGIWIFFYILLGYVWLYVGAYLIERYLDFSWSYDVIHLDNKAAVFTAAGGFMGLTLIYAGANIGDGPGWWVVFIAGGMGFAAWFGLAWLGNLAAHIIERITVDRDTGCGIRFGAYLLASGLILARASGGDWTSLEATFAELMVGWPVLPLAALFVLVERVYISMTQGRASARIVSSVFWAFIFLACAVIALMLLPSLDETPIGRLAMVLLWAA